MSKKDIKISYDRESMVLSVAVKRGKSVDSDIHGNVVVDYGRNGDVVRVNFYHFSFDDFREGAGAIRHFMRREESSVSAR